jgi:hypothetical protein
MSRIRFLVQFIISVIIVGILINLISDYVGRHYEAAEEPLIVAGLAAITVWILIVVTDISYTRLTAGRYAVEAFILNDRHELLLWRHPFHKVMLPPGGRVGRREFPNQALQARLEERLNLNATKYEFDERFHQDLNVSSANLGEVQRLPAPFIVQREIHKQRAFVKYHYDLIYVLRLLPGQTVTSRSKYDPVRFVDLKALIDMTASGKVYPDVLDAYHRILTAIGQSRRFGDTNPV